MRVEIDECAEKYLNDVIKKELEWDIHDTKPSVRRLALEEMYRRTFGEEVEYVSQSKEASSDSGMR